MVTPSGQPQPTPSGSTARGPTTNPASLVAQKDQEIQHLTAQLTDAMQQLSLGGNTIGNNYGAPVNNTKVPPPKKFDGKHKHELKGFLLSLELYTRFNKLTFPTPRDEVLAATLHLEGDALDWVQPYVNDFLEHEGKDKDMMEGTRNIFKNIKRFREEIGKIFGEMDEERQAERKLQTIKQRGPAQHYTTEFMQLRAKVNWGDAPLQLAYYTGLKERVKDELARDERPENLDDLITEAVRIDNRLYERELERKGQQTRLWTSNRPNIKKKVKETYHWDPMDIDHVKMTRKDRKPKYEKGQKWDNKKKEQKPKRQEWSAEKKKRFEDRVCLGCGEKGHFVKECPTAKTSINSLAISRVAVMRMVPNKPKEKSEPFVVINTDNETETAAEDTEGDTVPDTESEESEEEQPRTMTLTVPKRVTFAEQQGNTSGQSKKQTNIEWNELEDGYKKYTVNIDAASIRRRCDSKQCWICGYSTHLAGECGQRAQRFNVTGRGAEEAAQQTLRLQPYPEPSVIIGTVIKNLGLPAKIPVQRRERQTELATQIDRHILAATPEQMDRWRKADKWAQEQYQLSKEKHEKRPWHECNQEEGTRCPYHTREYHETCHDAWAIGHCMIEPEDCTDADCGEHQEVPHQSLPWTNCDLEKPCGYHYDQLEKCKKNATLPHHIHVTAKYCLDDKCGIHYKASEAYRKIPILHERKLWTECYGMCKFHQRKKNEAARDQFRVEHRHLHDFECKDLDCTMHQKMEKKHGYEPEDEEVPEPLSPRRQARRQGEHFKLHWTQCLENCATHRAERQKYEAETKAKLEAPQDSELHKEVHWAECQFRPCTIHELTEDNFGQRLGEVVNDLVQESTHKEMHWIDCDSTKCPRHKKQKEDYEKILGKKLREPNDPHFQLHWSKCEEDACPKHYFARQKESTTNTDISNLGKPVPRLEEEQWHKQVHFSECQVEDCTDHPWNHTSGKNGFEGKSNPWHKEVDPSLCLLKVCVDHPRTSITRTPTDPIKDVQTGAIIHDQLHWTKCREKDCIIHFQDKENAKQYSMRRQPKKSKN